MSKVLVKYEAACRAIAECTSVDEVKGWTDKAAAMQAYQRMAGDRTLESQASEIRIRAERRLGELLLAQKSSGGMNRGTRLAGTTDGKSSVVVRDDRREKPTIADAGISKDLSSRAQKLAAVPGEEFEAELAAKRERDRQDGARVSARLEQSGSRHLAKKQKRELPQAPDAEYEVDNLRATVHALAERNEHLEARLAVEAMDASEDEKTAAATLIRELQSQVKTLEAEADALRSMRDSLLVENRELKGQCVSLVRRLKKLEPAK